MTVAESVTVDLSRGRQSAVSAASFGEGLLKLLMALVSNLLRHQAADRRFQEKYRTTFEQFRAERLGIEMSVEVEQDYFDWELTVTGIEEVREELERLEASVR